MILPPRFEEDLPTRETTVYQAFEYYCPNKNCHERITASAEQLAIVTKQASPDEEYDLALQQIERKYPYAPYCHIHDIKMVPFLKEAKKVEELNPKT